MSATVRIGNRQGFWGDSPDAAFELMTRRMDDDDDEMAKVVREFGIRGLEVNVEDV